MGAEAAYPSGVLMESGAARLTVKEGAIKLKIAADEIDELASEPILRALPGEVLKFSFRADVIAAMPPRVNILAGVIKDPPPA